MFSLYRSSGTTVATALAVGLVFSAGCGRTGLQSAELDTEPALGDTSEDAALDIASNDTTDDPAADATDDAEPDVVEMDVQNDPTERPDVLEPAPEIPTPPRSDELDLLYCGLDNGHIVQGALRASACLQIPLHSLLLDAAQGYVHGPLLTERSLAGATSGNCDFLRCLSNADDCDDAQRCQNAKVEPDVCEFGESGQARRCVGEHLEVCTRDEAGSSWVRVQDCSRMQAECVVTPCGDDPNCVQRAACETETLDSQCGSDTSCDGDTLVRCPDRGDSGLVRGSARIDCSQLIDGGTCSYEPYTGPDDLAPICTVPDADCLNAAGDGFSCTGFDRLSLCLYGRIIEIACQDYGYSDCNFDQPVGPRCVP